MKQMIFRVLPIFLIILAGLLSVVGCSQSESPTAMKAAIIDQLDVLYPNEVFIKNATQQLETLGLEVDVFHGDEITVDFYRHLPEQGYRIIIFRVHSGLLAGNPNHEGITWLYTNEPYSKTAHLTDQLTDRATMAQTSMDSPKFFAISSKFIQNGMKGEFDNTVIILLGCDSMHLTDLAFSLVDRGASVCIGWHRSVTLDHSDSTFSILLDKLCSSNTNIVEGMLETMQECGPDPETGATLKYYPQNSGIKELEALIKAQ